MFISPFLIPIVAIVGSFLYVIIKTLAHSRVRELEIRERIAMIERGLVPPPEVDPKGFDRAMSRLDRHEMRSAYRGGYGSYGGRHRRAGVTLMGVGFGLMVLITFAGESPSSALGVGGFLVVMGIAFFVNGLIDTRPETSAGGSASPSVPVATPPEPPHRD